MSNKRIENNHPFIIGVYFIEKHSLNKIYEEKKENMERITMVEEFSNQLGDEDEITIEKISLSPFDNMTKDLMKDPVKG